MARARNIKPGLFKNEILGVADPLYTLLFEGLWLLADREGRLEDRPMRIKAEVFPYRDGLDVAQMLGWLEAREFIRRYHVKGVAYIQVTEFAKHQSPHKNEAPSEIPGPEAADTRNESLATASESLGTTRADSLIPDSGFLIHERASAKPPRPSAFDPLAAELPEWLSAELWAMWVKHRASIRRPIKTEDTVKGCFRSLERFWSQGVSVEDVIYHAIGSGNQGLFAPPNIRAQGPPKQSFARTDAQDKAARVGVLTGNLVNDKTLSTEVIDVSARSMDRPDLLEDDRYLRVGVAAHVGRR